MSDKELLRIYSEGWGRSVDDPHLSGLRAVYEAARKARRETRRG